MGKLINGIPGSRLLISSLPKLALRMHVFNRSVQAIQHAFWKRSLVNLTLPYCVSRPNVTPVFSVYSLIVISIETEFLEMKLDIDRVFGLFFSLKYDLLYRLGLDGISACFCLSSLN